MSAEIIIIGVAILVQIASIIATAKVNAKNRRRYKELMARLNEEPKQ